MKECKEKKKYRFNLNKPEKDNKQSTEVSHSVLQCFIIFPISQLLMTLLLLMIMNPYDAVLPGSQPAWQYQQTCHGAP